MTINIPNEFYDALNSKEITFISPDDEIPAGFLSCGKYQMADNIDLAAGLCDQVAHKTRAFWTLTQYLRLQNNTPEKPIEPKLDDPAFASPKIKYKSDLERKVARAVKYKEAHKQYEKRNKSYQKLLLQIRTIRTSGKFDAGGYLDFVVSTLQVELPNFVQSFFFTPKVLLISEKAREKHTFISGSTGSGKSEIIKHIVRHYVTKDTKPSLVILDPHGDLGDDIARFKEFYDNDRLVFIKPYFFKGRFAAFNPFDFPDSDETSLNRGQVQFSEALQQILGREFSDAQKNLVPPVLGVMLHKKGTNFHDLIRFMDDDRNQDLVEYGRTKLPNPVDQEFFIHNFYGENYNSTKEALSSRFRKLIREPELRKFLCNETTFDLPALLEQGKVIIFSFDRGYLSRDCISALGQLMTAYLITHAMKRPKGKRHPIHLIIDECQYMISPAIEEIMGETRKFGLYATLATQRVPQLGKTLDAVLSNVQCFIVGRNKSKSAQKLGDELPLSSEQIKSMPKYSFYCIEEDKPPVLTKSQLVGSRFALETNRWRELLNTQGRLYYRKPTPLKAYDDIEQQGYGSSKKRGPRFKPTDIST